MSFFAATSANSAGKNTCDRRSAVGPLFDTRTLEGVRDPLLIFLHIGRLSYRNSDAWEFTRELFGNPFSEREALIAQF